MIQSEILTSLIRGLIIKMRIRLGSLVKVLEAKRSLSFWLRHQSENCTSKILESWILSMQGIPSCLLKCVDKSIIDALTLLIIKESLEDKACLQGLCRKNEDNSSCNLRIKRLIEGVLKSPSFREEYFSKLENVLQKGLLKVMLTVYLKLLPDFYYKGVDESLLKRESLRIFEFVTSLATLCKWHSDDIIFDGDVVHFVVVPIAAKYLKNRRPISIDIELSTRLIEDISSQGRDVDAIFVVAIGVCNSLVAERATQSFLQRNSKEFTIRMKNDYFVLSSQGSQKRATTIFLRRVLP